MGIKGYVVRWVGSGDGKRWCDSPGEAAAEAWGRSLSDRCSDVAIFRVHADGREERLPSYEEAIGEIERLKDRSRMVRDVDEALHAAGIEARHGEKLGERAARAAMHRCEGPCCNKPAAGVTCSEECAANLSAWLNQGDPFAALEAAERRLLEAGGWRPGPRPGIWTDPHGGNCSQADAVYSERLDISTRLAAKGGV